MNCEVIEGNNTVVKLHKKFFFEEEGFRRSNIIKEGHRRGIHFLGLTKENWNSGKKSLYEKYNKIFNMFSIIINLESK